MAEDISRLYRTARWEKVRALQLQMHPLCRYHLEGRGEVVPATVCDHIVPHRGDVNLVWVPMSGYQSLCLSCHSSRKADLERYGYARDIGLNVWPLDKNHPANSGKVPQVVKDRKRNS